MEPQLTPLEKLFPFQVIEVRKADGTIVHSVEGIATSEAVDKDGEIADFPGTLKNIKSWSDEALKKTSTNGQEPSMGNIRVQHDSKLIGGKVTAIEPKEATKKIFIATEPRTEIWNEYIKGGFVTGFSIAGSYESRVCNVCKTDKPGRTKYCTDCKENTVSRFVPTITEISYVDNACNPDAEFLTVKADGTQLMRKFSDLRRAAEACTCTCQHCKDGKCAACNNPTCDSKHCAHGDKAASVSAPGVIAAVKQILTEAGVLKEPKTKKVGDRALPASDFAFVGDAENPATWLLPIHDAAHCRKHLSRFSQVRGIPAEEREKVQRTIIARARKLSVKVTSESEKCVRAALVKVLTEHLKPAGEKEALVEAEKLVATVEEVIEKVDGETKLFKGLYTVSSLAEVLQNLQWIVASTEYERDYEGDDSQVPDDLRSVLEDLIPVFVAMASEEAKELLTQNKKSAANGGLGGTNMDDKNAAELMKAAKELAQQFWKKAKNFFHKMAKCHEAIAKTFHKAAEHHEGLAEHHTSCGEAAAEKSVTTELEKLANGAEFKKMASIDQLLAKADILEKAKGSAGLFGKMAKCHGNIAKCMSKAAGHHEDLDKHSSGLGDAEEAPGMGGSSKDDAGAHQGGSSEKAAADKIAELEKALAEAKKGAASTESTGNEKVIEVLGDIAKALKEQGETIAGVRKDVDEKLNKLGDGPGDAAKRNAAGNRLAGDRNSNGNGDAPKEGEGTNRLERVSGSGGNSAKKVSSSLYA